MNITGYKIRFNTRFAISHRRHVACTSKARLYTSVERNQVLFTRNNVIVDTLQNLTNNPYVFEDEELSDYNILKNNKELAMFYCMIILGCIAYIVISDFWGNRGNDETKNN